MPFAHTGEIAALVTAALWAFAVILFRKSADRAAPLALNLFKNTISLALFVPTLLLAGSPFLPDWSATDWVLVTLSGVLGLALGDTLFLAALGRIGAGLWAVIDCLYSPLVVLFAFLFLGERLTPLHGVGGALVLSAVLLASAEPPSHDVPRRRLIAGMLFGVAAVGCMAAAAVLAKPVVTHSDLLTFTGVRLALGNAPLLLLVLRSRWRAQLGTAFVPSSAWKVSVPAGLLGTYLALILWLVGIKYTLVGVSSLLNQLATIMIFVLARLFLNEPLTPRRMIAIGLAASGAAVLLSA